MLTYDSIGSASLSVMAVWPLSVRSAHGAQSTTVAGTATLFGSLKVERFHGMRFGTRRAAKDEVMDWLQFYNHRSLHSTLGYLSPMNFEKARANEKRDLAKKKERPHSQPTKGDVKSGQVQQSQKPSAWD
jgi:hypothetical protein